MIKANEKIMSVKEAAEFLGFTTVHVRNLCESKQLAASELDTNGLSADNSSTT